MRAMLARAVLIAVALLLAAAAGGGERTPLFQALVKSFADREQAAQWAKIRCKDRFTMTKGYALKPGTKDQFLPLTDISWDGSVVLTLGPEKWRFEWDTQAFNLDTETLVPIKGPTVFANHTSKSFTPIGGMETYPSGIIHRSAKEYQIPKFGTLKPLFLLFRPLGFRLFDEGKYSIKGEASVGGIPAVIIAQKEAPRWSFWLEKRAPFSILRWSQETESGKLAVKCDFSYTKEDPIFPRKWEYASYWKEGELWEQLISEISELRLGEPLPDREFELEFPARTIVRDITVKRKDAVFLVEKGGAMREITGQNPKEAYDRSGEEPDSSNGSRVAPIALIVASTAGLMVLAWFLMKLKRKEGKQ